jgi:hypothetical protein
MHTYRNPQFRIDDRVEDLLGRMSLEERIEQFAHDAPTNDRLAG